MRFALVCVATLLLSVSATTPTLTDVQELQQKTTEMIRLLEVTDRALNGWTDDETARLLQDIEKILDEQLSELGEQGRSKYGEAASLTLNDIHNTVRAHIASHRELAKRLEVQQQEAKRYYEMLQESDQEMEQQQEQPKRPWIWITNPIFSALLLVTFVLFVVSTVIAIMPLLPTRIRLILHKWVDVLPRRVNPVTTVPT